MLNLNSQTSFRVIPGDGGQLPDKEDSEIDCMRRNVFCMLGGGGGFVLSCFSDSFSDLKNIDFSQLLICCWLELDISLLDAMESKIGPS